MDQPCHKCGKRPMLHALIGTKLACAWEGRQVVKEGDWGRQTPIVVEQVYLMIGKKVPYNVAKAAKEART